MADREKIIRALELCRYDPDPGQETKWDHSCLKCPYCTDFTGMGMDCARMYTDAIALLREQEKNGWVSIEERLPEKSAWYLVSLVNTRTGHRWKVPASADYSHGKWDYAYLGGDDATWMQNNTVTHWMPLPEPPEEVSGDAGND